VRVFVDSNIPMYVAGRPHPNREPARRFLERMRAAVHVAVMLNRDVRRIARFDTSFDAIAGVERVAPT